MVSGFGGHGHQGGLFHGLQVVEQRIPRFGLQAHAVHERIDGLVAQPNGATSANAPLLPDAEEQFNGGGGVVPVLDNIVGVVARLEAERRKLGCAGRFFKQRPGNRP